MMFGPNSVQLSTAAGCATASGKMPKCRYGAFFAGMAETAREEDEYFAKRKAAKKANRQQKAEQQQQQKEDHERRGLSKRLLGKLVRLISVKDFSFLPSGKTFPSKDAKKAAAIAARRRCQNASQSSTLSGSFEPMPTIEEETESELVEQLMAEAEAACSLDIEQQHLAYVHQQQQFFPTNSAVVQAAA